MNLTNLIIILLNKIILNIFRISKDFWMEQSKRTYIRRKRCLSEIKITIRNALQQYLSRSGREYTEDDLETLAKKHSNEIEAACYFPKQRMTEMQYSTLLTNKAEQLLSVLLSRNSTSNNIVSNNIGSVSNVISHSDSNPSDTVLLKNVSCVQPKGPPIRSELDSVDRCSPCATPPPIIGMSGIELRSFINRGCFDYTNITPDMLPPLIDRRK